MAPLKPVYPSDPSIQIPTLGPNACNYYLHWASWIPMGYPIMRRGSYVEELLQNELRATFFSGCIFRTKLTRPVISMLAARS